MNEPRLLRASALCLLAAWLVLVVMVCNGCVADNLSKIIGAAANDPARVHAEVVTPWGTAKYDRDNSATTNRALPP